MKELKNLVTVTGKLVKNNIEELTTKKGEEAIGGSLVLRTADDSEHEINFFAYKYKKDENKNFTSEESYFYKQYTDAMNLKDIEQGLDGWPISGVTTNPSILKKEGQIDVYARLEEIKALLRFKVRISEHLLDSWTLDDIYTLLLV